MNKIRHMLADAIENNGGYSRGYHGRWALSYEVGLYYANLDKDHIYEVMCKEHGYLPPPTSLEWDEQQQWEGGQESMCYGLNDDDGNRTYGPDTAKRYSLPWERFPRRYVRDDPSDSTRYPSAKPGWKLVNPWEDIIYFDVTFGLAGRGGKHLVVEEFEGHRLDMSANDLAERIRDDDAGNYSNRWCTYLLAMMGEWDAMFTSKIASAELEYQAAFRMYSELYDQAQAWRTALKEARAAREVRRLAQVQAAVLA